MQHSTPRTKKSTGPSSQLSRISCFDLLPDLLVLRILSLLGVVDVCRASRVSKRFHALACDFLLWQRLYDRRWPLEYERRRFAGLVNYKKLFVLRVQQQHPSRPPSIKALRPRWVPDGEQPVCSHCQHSFSIRRRRHHCRCCGRLFCDACSMTRMPLPGLRYVDPVRVCVGCVAAMRPPTPPTRKPSTAKGLKIVVVGASGVGKSVLINRFITGDVLQLATPTVGANFLTKNVRSSTGSIVKLQIWDTAGSEAFQGLMKMYYMDCQMAVLAFDATNEATLVAAGLWLSRIRQETGDHVVFCLVACKCDDDRIVTETTSRMRPFAVKHSIDIFGCTSATSDKFVDSYFQELLEVWVALSGL
eukprot:TRINITY_DN9138_c0_g1_i2.p1 TRINITY_DN9138_c0_g1~~TRINITY_DN9138_c0_g1_i2.p1  ORF type:complete len:360 (-),score=78.79 TRINITY_DN9138_c0_g1_i2:364-1443(-)